MVVCFPVSECNPLVCSCRQLNKTAANLYNTALSSTAAKTNRIYNKK